VRTINVAPANISEWFGAINWDIVYVLLVMLLVLTGASTRIARGVSRLGKNALTEVAANKIRYVLAHTREEKWQ